MLKEKKLDKNILYFLLISFLFVISLCIFKVINDDGTTHISRIYFLSQEFKKGNFNPSMYQGCYFSYGYPFGIFYPDTFIKPFSFLVYLGINEYIVSIIFLFLTNFLTLFIPYKLLNKLKIEKSFLISLIYFLYPYRFYDYFRRFSFAELLFFVFFPFIIYGLYKMFKNKEFSIGLFIGLYGLCHSHILSTLLVIIFLICFYLYKIKFIKNNLYIIKYTFINSIFTILTCIDVILPILEAQRQETILYEIYPDFIGKVNDNTIQIINQTHITNIIGYILFCILIGICIYKKNNLKIVSICSLLSMLLISTNLFNWDYITNIFNKISIIQFPYRFLLLGIIPYVYLCFLIDVNWNKVKYFTIKIFLILELLIMLLNGSLYFKYDKQYLDYGIGRGDYLPYNIDIQDFSFFNYNSKQEIKNDIYLSENGYLPIFYYHNYKLVDKDNNIYEYENKNGLIYVDKLKNNNIELNVIYQQTLIQNLSYLVSLVSMFCICIGFFYYNKKIKKFLS